MVKLWKSINSEIIEAIKTGNIDKLQILVDKRDEILNSVDIKEFKKELGNDINDEFEIQSLLQTEMNKIKSDIQKYKLTKTANYSYTRNNNTKINIFNQKV